MTIFSILLLTQFVWQNTGELVGAVRVSDITLGLNGYLYAGAKGGTDPGSADSGWVFVSQDLWNWQVCSDIPGTQEGVFCLFNGNGDTLFAGTGMWSELPRVFKSSDGGLSWVILNGYGTYRPGTRVTAFLEDNLGILHLGNNYMGMSAAIPRRSTDRGTTWLIDDGTINYNSTHYCFCQESDGTLYFGSWGTGGGVHRSFDNGANWSPTTALTGVSDSYSIIEVGADTIFVGADSSSIGKLYRTTDHGDSWTQMGIGYFSNTTALRSLCAVSYNNMIFAGTAPNAEVFVSLDRGNTWSSTGTLAGATVVYDLLEVRKQFGRGESIFVYAATGPNGDVFRALLGVIIGVDENQNTKQNSAEIQVFPNPFRNNCMIQYALGTMDCAPEGVAGIKIFDICGRLVKSFNHLLANQRGGIQPFNHIVWFGEDDLGRKLPVGVYFICLENKDYQKVEKAVLHK